MKGCIRAAKRVAFCLGGVAPTAGVPKANRPIGWQPILGRHTWHQLLLLVSVGVASVSGAAVGPQENSISLAGTWRFRLDPDNVGVEKRWFAEKLDDSVTLPGTTDTNQKGVFKDEQAVDRLSRVWYWKGPAWYQREVVIPEAWKGKRITLLLERTKNTRVWVDDKDCGAEDTLSAPQVFDLTAALTPGRHTLTVLVDNAKLPPVGPSHAVDERTQSNWNGIIGRMELRATDPVWLDDVQVYPDAATGRRRVRAVVGNITGQAGIGATHVRLPELQRRRSGSVPRASCRTSALPKRRAWSPSPTNWATTFRCGTSSTRP